MPISRAWEEAFDSLNPDALVSAFKRFRIVHRFAIPDRNIHCNRRSRVVESNNTSTARVQRARISQGCPPSPFLFVILMTVVVSVLFLSWGKKVVQLSKRSGFGSLTPVTDLHVRNVGRPRNEWTKMLFREAQRMAGSLESLSHIVYDAIRWRARVFEDTAR